MWQSQVVVLLHVLIALLCSKHSGVHGAYVKGGACMHWVNSFHIYTACMSPTLSENSALEHCKQGNTMEIHELNNV